MVTWRSSLIRSLAFGASAGLIACTLLHATPIVPGRVVSRLESRPAITDGSLHLALTGIDDDDLADMRGLASLRALDLFGTRVGDAGLVHLAGSRGLRSLYLESTSVSDAGLAHLGRLPELRTLALSGTRVTDAGLVHLRGLTRLEALDLTCTAVTAAGAEELRRALPGAEITHGAWPR